MQAFLNKQRRWLLPAVLILFILEVIALPFALDFTWAGRSETPERVLTYTPGKLTWDSEAGIYENGAAKLSLFEALYENVEADDGDKIVAPGTDGGSIVRLKNDDSASIFYTAVLYRIRTSELLAVEASLTGDNFTDTKTYTLPEGIKDENVLRAVCGTVESGMIQDFDIGWQWKFYEDEQQDIIDTWLGDKAKDGNADDVTVGLYIVVKDENTQIIPDPPHTGDIGISIYIVLICISGAVLIFLIIDKIRSRKCK